MRVCRPNFTNWASAKGSQVVSASADRCNWSVSGYVESHVCVWRWQWRTARIVYGLVCGQCTRLPSVGWADSLSVWTQCQRGKWTESLGGGTDVATAATNVCYIGVYISHCTGTAIQHLFIAYNTTVNWIRCLLAFWNKYKSVWSEINYCILLL